MCNVLILNVLLYIKHYILLLIDVSVNIRTSATRPSHQLQFIFKELKICLFLNEFFYNFVVFCVHGSLKKAVNIQKSG